VVAVAGGAPEVAAALLLAPLAALHPEHGHVPVVGVDRPDDDADEPPGRVLGVVAQVGLARRGRQDLLVLAPHVPHELLLDEHVAGQPLQLADHDPVALVVLQGVEDVGPAVALGGGASGPGRLGDHPDDAVAVVARPGPDGCLLAGVALFVLPGVAGACVADQPHP
jgi:hypothetical protein